MPLTLNLQSYRLPTSPIIRVSSTADGVIGDGASSLPVLSADGRYVFFESYSGNLVTDDKNGFCDIFRKDLVTGAVMRVSVSATSPDPAGDSTNVQVSANGRYVVFNSWADQMVEGDQNGCLDVFRKDLVTGELVRVTVGSGGGDADNDSSKAQISADGSRVVFQSFATNLVDNDGAGILDVFVRDMTSNGMVRVSSALDGSEADGASFNAQISADGRYVVFQSEATNLVSGDTEGCTDVFIKDLKDNTLKRLSALADGTGGNDSSYNAQISANGRYVVFESYAWNLTAGDTGNYRDIFRKDLMTGEITRVSVSADNVEADGDSMGAQISADGRYVTFSSDARNLVAGDTNNRTDVFRKDLVTGEVVRLSTTLTPVHGKEQPDGPISGGQISADGKYLVFTSYASNLVTGDTNGMGDVFIKNLTTQEIVRVSTDASGAQANSYSENAEIVTAPGGRYVLFESAASNLIADDKNNTKDIFLKNLDTNAVTRLSAGADGTEANGMSDKAHLSADGKYAVFGSYATNLVTGDGNGTKDVFVKNLETGKVIRVSSNAGGDAGNDYSDAAQIAISASNDHHYIVFASRASDLVTGDTNNASDIFLKDLETGEIRRISTAADGTQGTSFMGSSEAQISADGKYVVFTSNAKNFVAGETDTNNATDIFRKNIETGEIIRVSKNSLGEQATGGYSTAAKISASGDFVAFVSTATNLVAGDTNGRPDIFLKDIDSGVLKRVSVTVDGFEANGTSYDIRSISDDGRYVIFTSDASNLVAGDTNNAEDIFRKDMETGEVVRLTMTNRDAQGYEPANSSSDSVQVRLDGQVVVFQTDATNTADGDTNNGSDIFIVDGNLDQQQAMAEGRFVDLSFDVGTAASATIAWGDGITETATSALGYAFFRHAYATTGIKDVLVTVQEGSQTRAISYVIDLNVRTVGRNMAAYDTLSGGVDVDQLVGDDFANLLIGNSGNDKLEGGAGNDKLIGGIGNDILAGGVGQDIFVFDTKLSSSNRDKVLDFNSVDDTIYLENKYMTKLKAGKLASSAFYAGSKAHDSSDRIIYYKSKGYLYYDADGTGASKQVLIGTFTPGTKIAYHDLFII